MTAILTTERPESALYENRICAEDAVAVHHYPAESRLYRVGHKVLAWAMPVMLVGVVLALIAGVI